MKKYNVVKLINMSDKYKGYNLYLDAVGVVIDSYQNKSKIMFFNAYNEGDYSYIEVENNDIEIIEDKVPIEFINFIKENLPKLKIKEKGFKPKEFRAYQKAKLLVEDEKYYQFGIHQGDIGTIMEDYAVQDYVLVDFCSIDGGNNYIGDCISVKLQDLEILKEES